MLWAAQRSQERHPLRPIVSSRYIQALMRQQEAERLTPFSDTLVMPQPDNSLITTVYRNPTDTDLYLQWDRHYNLAAKFSVINTLTHRTRTVCSNPGLLREEEDHFKQALWKYNYPVWDLNRANIKSNNTNKGSNNIKNNQTSNDNMPHIVVPYIKGLSESCKNTYSKHGIQMYF